MKIRAPLLRIDQSTWEQTVDTYFFFYTQKYETCAKLCNLLVRVECKIASVNDKSRVSIWWLTKGNKRGKQHLDSTSQRDATIVSRNSNTKLKPRFRNGDIDRRNRRHRTIRNFPTPPTSIFHRWLFNSDVIARLQHDCPLSSPPI